MISEKKMTDNHFGKTPLNFNIVQHNATQSPVKFSYYETFDGILINNSGNFSLAVTGMKIPTFALETFIMGTPSDYAVTIYGGGQVLSGPTASVTVALPSTDQADPQNSAYCNGGDILYYSPQQLVDILSRTIYRAYRGWMQIAADAPNVSTMSITLTDTGSPVYSLSGSATQSAGSTLLAQTSIADISFTISNNTLKSISSSGVTTNIKIEAQMPSTTSPNPNPYVVIYASNEYNSIDPAAGSNYSICLTEAAFRSPPAFYQPQLDVTNAMYALPVTSFVSSFNNNGPPTGVWNFQISSDYLFSGSVTITANISGNIAGKPNLPPSVSLDSTNKKLSLHYQSNWVYSGMRLAFSPKLYSMINMGASVTSYNSNKSLYEFIYPPLTSSSATAPISAQGYEINTYVQQQSTMYDMMNISRIVVKSNNLRCESEYGQSLVSDTVISDFKVNTDVEYLGDLTYTTDAGGVPWRRYKMTSNTPTRTIDIAVAAEYDNGLRRDIYLAPGQSASVRLSFFNEGY